MFDCHTVYVVMDGDYSMAVCLSYMDAAWIFDQLVTRRNVFKLDRPSHIRIEKWVLDTPFRLNQIHVEIMKSEVIAGKG